MISEGHRYRLRPAPIRHEPNAREAEDHHGPCRGFGDGGRDERVGDNAVSKRCRVNAVPILRRVGVACVARSAASVLYVEESERRRVSPASDARRAAFMLLGTTFEGVHPLAAEELRSALETVT